MQLSPLPDLGSNRRLVSAAVAVTLAVAVALALHDNDLAKTFGDTDDAMRLVLVRDLLHGRGWYDQWVGRLQPPVGTYMHWSRLLDGALAGLMWLFERVVSPDAAELAVRFVWPLAWILPAACCGLLIIRALGGSPAVAVGAVLLATNLQLYGQFRPGRIDHHNVQITMTLIAAACALAAVRRIRWAVVAGLAAALGLAIGIEALAFQALIGASYGYRLMRDPNEAGPARAYGLSLALGAAGFFLIQTPPWRWSMSFCDALGWNLIAALMAAGLGLAAIATWAARSKPVVRLGLLAGLGCVAAGVFLAIDPQCVHGPFGAVDPRVRPFWFDKILELQSWEQLLVSDPSVAIRDIIVASMAVLAAVFLLAREGRSPQPQTLLITALVAVAVWAAAHANRMQDYVYWFGVPALAAAISLVSVRRLRNRMLPTILLTLALSPICVSGAALSAAILTHKTAVFRPEPINKCYDRTPYAPLAGLPPGVVLAESDLGPFILAETGDSVLAAPYHRMAWGILAAHEAQGAAPANAEALIRALKVDYIVECPTIALRVGPNSFEASLQHGETPGWLAGLSTPGQVLQIYRVLPKGRGR